MFVSAAVKITSEVYARLKPLLDDLGLKPEHAQVVQDMLTLRQLPHGPSIAEIARVNDLSAQTVGKLDREARPTQPRARYKSTFISYGGPDEAVARRLYIALLDNGVQVFYFPESSIQRKKLHRTMNDAVYEYEVVISLC